VAALCTTYGVGELSAINHKPGSRSKSWCGWHPLGRYLPRDPAP
jgi:hypothetical protein